MRLVLTVAEILAPTGGGGEPALLQRAIMSGWSMHSGNTEQNARLLYGYSRELALTRPGGLQANGED